MTGTICRSSSQQDVWSRLSSKTSPRLTSRVSLGKGSLNAPPQRSNYQARRASAPEVKPFAADQKPAPRVPLITAALQAVFDGSDKMCTSRATAGLLLLSDLLPHHGHSDTVRTRTVSDTNCSGQAALERIFFNSMPEELVEIVSLDRIVQPARSLNFMEFLGRRGTRPSSLNIDVMFSPKQEENDQETPFACMAHRIVPVDLAGDKETFTMNAVIVAVDPVSNEKNVLDVRSILYRLTETGKSLSDRDLDERFRSALKRAVGARLLLADSPVSGA